MATAARNGINGDSNSQEGPIGGYPLEIFGKDFDHKFICGYCEKVLRDPWQIFCGHRFCRSCIRAILRENVEVQCKTCVEEGAGDVEYSQLKEDQMFPDNAARRDMNRLSAKCIFPGCNFSKNFKAYLDHEKVCQFRPVPCPACHEEVPFCHLQEHQVQSCPQRRISCKFCNAEFCHADAETHNGMCAKYPLRCQHCNKTKIPRDKMEVHLMQECSRRQVSCPAGCSHQGITADQFHKHVADQEGRHLAWAIQKVAELERQVMGTITEPAASADLAGMGAAIDELQGQVHTLLSGAQAAPPQASPQSPPQQSGTQNNVPQRLEVVELKLSAFEPIMGVLHREIERCLQAIEALDRQMQERLASNPTTNTQRDQQIVTLERSLQARDVRIAELECRLQYLEHTSYDGTLLWRISNFAQRRNDAITNRTTSLYSPPFFTGRTGYKMCARIYPNGDGMGRGSHVSLFFVVMRGPYDSLLPWPFQQKVTLILVDQNYREHIQDTFKPDASSTSFKRPTTEMNIASGCPLFLPLSKLHDQQHGYVKDDTMFVKVVVDTAGLEKYTDLNPQRGALPTSPPPNLSH